MKRVFWLLMVLMFVVVSAFVDYNMAGATSVTRQAVSLLKNRYGITATPEEINTLDGITATVTELNYTDGVTSAIQTQLDAKTGTSLADGKFYIGNAGTALPQTISGIIAITNQGVASGTLADTKVWIGNSGGKAVAQTLSGLATISNAGVLTGTLADAKVWIGNSASKAIAVTPSGDWTITNAGVASLAVNSVSAPQVFTNTVTVTCSSATNTGRHVLVEAGSILLSVQPISGFSNDVTITKAYIDTTSGSSLENYFILNTDAGGGQIVNAVFLRP